ncbi:MAG TPA: class I SAM-dependent methyltransferase [Pirellulaceae bacterium]|nr:class I SAM-dependent methyltransferase [Pirellulaceae bacterium]
MTKATSDRNPAGVMSHDASVEKKLERAISQIRGQRDQIARLRQQVQHIQKVIDFCLGDPQASWLYRWREERMDPNSPIFDPLRCEFHLARYRFAAEFVAGCQVMDVACGTGYGSRMLVDEGGAKQVFGFDVSPEAIEYANAKYRRPNIEFAVADGRDLPVAPETMDVVVSFETLEHVSDGDRLVAEFARVLRPGGRLIISTPNAWPLSIAPFHFKEYNRDSFLDQLRPHFQVQALFNQNSGSDFEFNRNQPAGIIPTTDVNHELAECFLALCHKGTPNF